MVSHSLLLPVGARRLGVAVRHAPLGVAKRPCHCSIDTISTHTTTPKRRREPKPFTGVTTSRTATPVHRPVTPAHTLL